MQSKTIAKSIHSKMDDWLSTIENDALKKSLRKDIIVTGGCITSMFLNETVNDYDVYIRTRDTLKSLVCYYTSMISSGCLILDGINKDDITKDLEEEYGKPITDISNCYASAVRNLKYDQIRLFFDGSPGYKADIKTATDNDGKVYTPKYQVAFLSPNAISLTDDLQIVIRFWGEPNKVHESYDFVHATNYWTYDEGLVTNKDALECILTKQLKYKGSHYPVTSILRFKKFTKRNWNIGAGEALKIVFQCSQLDLTDIDVLEEQLIGVDVAYFAKLIEILRSIPNSKSMDYGYLCTIIDKVFNSSEHDE